jgi:NDP-sugar pyrophosphorylase family protein
MPSSLNDVTAVLLVGGMGTRLQPVLPRTPKPLAPIGEAPFLELLVVQLQVQGIRNLVMCTGHLADRIEAHFGHGQKWNVAIQYSKETQPFGTAGAVKLAKPYLEGVSDFLVLNGDSFLEMDFRELVRLHGVYGGSVTMAVRRVSDAARYGTVCLDVRNRVVRFEEKTGIKAPGIINGGVYVLSRAIFQHIPDGPASLEKNVFPNLPEQEIYAAEQDGVFVDIGTPEDYAWAQSRRQSLQGAAYRYGGKEVIP